jgi:hypothetical protein
MQSDNYTLDEMLAYAFPNEKERPRLVVMPTLDLVKRIKELQSLLSMKDIEISLLRRDVSRLRAVIRKRANLN